MKHTPTPWEYSGNGEAWGIKNAVTLQPVLIAKGDIRTNEANAAFIVRACNCHEELVEALKLASKYIAKMVADDIQTVVPPQIALDRIEYALTRATKEV